MSGSYRDLRVWQQGIKLALLVHRVAEKLSKHELYRGLSDQIRRAAVSIPSNIAEGKGHHTDREFLAYLYHARGSLLELETQMILAKELKYAVEADATQVLQATATLGSGLTGLINSLGGKAASSGA